MDIAAYLQCFESSMSSYTGDDPLDPWEKFIEYLEQKLPAESVGEMSCVFDSLVKRFEHVERYANDVRYVKYCIKCASYYGEPHTAFAHLYGKGVGVGVATFYVAWAQQLEQREMNDQAAAVFQKAVENQAQPADELQQARREFEMRTARNQTPVPGTRTPLRNSHLVNQIPAQREPNSQTKAPVDCQPRQYTVVVSSSEYSRSIVRSENSGVETVVEYTKDSLACEGSELCFEEVRAARYFQKLEERAETERAERLERERLERERLERERLERERLERERLERERLERERLERERLEREHLERERLEREHLERERLERERLERERFEQLERERLQRLERERLEHLEQLEKERAERLQTESKQRPGGAFIEPGALQPMTGRFQNIKQSLEEIGQELLPEENVRDHAFSWQFPQPQATVPQKVGITLPWLSSSHRSRRSLGLNLLSVPSFIQEASVMAEPEVPERRPEEPLRPSHSPSLPSFTTTTESLENQQLGAPQDARPPHGTIHDLESTNPNNSVGHPQDTSEASAAHHSHVTPNNSLGIVQATPSRVLPSPTVNTREALDVIMGMFQAPTLMEEKDFNISYTGNGGASSFVTATTSTAAAPFTVFQDNADKENSSDAAASAVPRPKPLRALSEIPVSKPDKANCVGDPDQENPSELLPDENIMWGARYHSLNSLAACPNSTSDFSLSAQLVSTPFTARAAIFSNLYEDQENNGDNEANACIIRQSKKLSPIIEQSPNEETPSKMAASQLDPSSARQGTIVGEGLASAPHCLTSSSITMAQPAPPAVLSFRDQTLGATSPARMDTGAWNVYVDAEPVPQISQGSAGQIPVQAESSEPSPAASSAGFDVLMSPMCEPRADWLDLKSPEAAAEPDLDAFLSPQPHRTARSPLWHCPSDVPMSPQLGAEVPMSPMQQQQQGYEETEELMSPRGEPFGGSRPSTSASGPLVEDPWNDELRAALLSSLPEPLHAHPRCVTWPCPMPNIAPKSTISMGGASLRVDSILGQGAFAAVYLATDPKTSEKVALKVQKPANPWEFYINTRLDARLQPRLRHLYANVYSAHLFRNGSMLLSELHNYGTLLNAVNLYKKLGDKVMPQPLVMYFTTCILHMVEQLHDAHIIHADIKPDNFLLGKRILDNAPFDPDSVDHGLALLDFGQSIDMDLFPEGTAFTGRCLTSGFQCTEMLSGKPWSYQTDYFGIAGTVHCLLFGTYMRVTNENGTWKTDATFRRNPHSDLWLDFFHTLLNAGEGRPPPSLRRLRLKMADALRQQGGAKLPALRSRLLVLLLESHRSTHK